MRSIEGRAGRRADPARLRHHRHPALTPSLKQHAPATARNREPILEVLRRVLPPTGTVLEIASGTGEHAVFFAAALPSLVWQPSDPDPAALASIAAHRDETGLPNLREPLRIDATAGDFGTEADAVVCINMIHIAPWRAAEGLFRGAGRVLTTGAPLVLYGPYRFDGVFTAESNAAFDASLRQRDREWGVRDVADIRSRAALEGLALEEVVALPANNHVLVSRKRGL